MRRDGVIQILLRKYNPKRNVAYLGLILLCSVSSNIIHVYKNDCLSEYDSISAKTAFINELKKDTQKMKFISEHLFTVNKITFKDFINNAAKELRIKKLSIESNEMTRDVVTKDLVTIHALFWHDLFLFKLMEMIYSFHSGFAKILSVEIEKVDNVSLAKPALEAKIVCEVFHVC
ncbi:MAG: hypothetical protein LBF65_02850 [Holosporales bacterium]|jgi:hypothetical protein|nr:hypothetical protein [Holosporales bacterium]